MSGSLFDVGRVVCITTMDGHVLRGRIVYSGPDRLMLVYDGGMHVVWKKAITDVG